MATKNDRTAPVKEWASESGDEKKLRDMMGASINASATSNETTERTVPDETSTHTPPEDAAQTNEVTTAATATPIATDNPEMVAAPEEYDRAASSAPDMGGEILGHTIISTADDETTERSEDSVLTESGVQTLPDGYDKVSAHTSPTSPSVSVADSRIIAETHPTVDSDHIRRTVKQRKSSLNEYRATFLLAPKIIDRKPVFVSRTTRDRLDRIVRLFGERGMSVSGLIENIALHHLAIHEADVEHWRKM